MPQSEGDADTNSAKLVGRAGRLAMESGQFVGMSLGQSVGDWECILGRRRDWRR